MKIFPSFLFLNKHLLSILLLTLGSMACTLPAMAQDEAIIDNTISISKMKARAKHALETGDPYTALFYYQEIVKKDESDFDNRMQLADLYRLTRNYKEAEKVYGYIRDKEPAKYPFSLYYKALMQKMTGNYIAAKENFLLFKQESFNLGDKNFKLLLPKEIAGCDSAIMYQEFPENIAVKNAGPSINNPHTEFSPLFVDDDNMLYGALHMDSLQYFDAHQEHYEKKPVRQIYQAEKINDQWQEQGEFDAFNDPTMDMGNFTYSPYTNRYYFSKCSRDLNGKVECKIYYTEKVNGKWDKPVMLPAPINLENHTSTQPAIVIDTTSAATSSAIDSTKSTEKKSNPKTATNKKQPAKKVAPSGPTKTEYLYFVSDRPEGKGGLDIWYTYYIPSKKAWAEPINFGLANTPQTECTPFFHIPSQVLYFSSDGQVNAGGLDVFKMQKEGRKFLKPQNLSFPINSPQDELGYTLNADGKKGFLVSNRPGGTPYFHETCCDDIFAFEIMPPKPFNCKLDLTVLKSDTTDCEGKWLTVRSTDLKTKAMTLDTLKLGKDCIIEMPLEKGKHYNFTMDLPGYIKDSLTLDTRDMASSDVLSKNLVMKPIEKPPVVVVIEKPNEGKAFVLKDIQYETDQTDLNEDAKAVLDTVLVSFLKEHPKDKILISSHTDDLGSHEYNMQLSKQRAAKVMKYLASKGIPHASMTAQGYGETKPLVPNMNPDGTHNLINKSINRRTEFLIIKAE
ncbi:MAG: ompA [Chitinophagaceae bacterium]|nr:ompA [Chitinophagaceae bacterium]